MIEIIAMGEMRKYLKENLPKFKDPVLLISSDFIPGCPMCNSSATVYYITLTERNSIPSAPNLEKAHNQKFPIDVYVKYPIQKGAPKQFVVGMKVAKGEVTMVLNRVVY